MTPSNNALRLHFRICGWYHIIGYGHKVEVSKVSGHFTANHVHLGYGKGRGLYNGVWASSSPLHTIATLNRKGGPIAIEKYLGKRKHAVTKTRR